MDQSGDDRRKAEQVERHYKQAERHERRKQNLAEKKARGGRRPPGRARVTGDPWDDDPEEHWDDGWQPQRAQKRVPGARPPRTIDGTDRARVASVARTHVEVLAEDGVLRRAQVAPRVFAGGGLVVGDEVALDGSGRVVARDDRRTLLERRAPGSGRGTKLIAANVDVGLVVIAPRDDGPSLGFIDRSVVALAAGGIEAAIVCTKADLLEDGSDEVRRALAPWEEAGHAVHLVSSVTGTGIEALREELDGRVAVLFGHSGVGKSTLINALDPSAGQLTGAVRASDGRGRHTTTSSRLLPMAGGGALVDTPGVRELVPLPEDLDGIVEAIPELRPLVGRCRYRDCAHGAEPGCALREAGEEDEAVRRALGRLERLLSSLEP